MPLIATDLSCLPSADAKKALRKMRRAASSAYAASWQHTVPIAATDRPPTSHFWPRAPTERAGRWLKISLSDYRDVI